VIKNNAARLHSLLDQQRALEFKIQNILLLEIPTVYGDARWLTIGSGAHYCTASPVELCVYHRIHDSEHDDCIFCHEPEERK